MSDYIAVRMQGVGDFVRTMERGGVELDELKSVNRAAAEIVASAALLFVPRQSGNLASTIRVTATARAGGIKFGGPRAPYANPIHWGWHRKHIRAQPFATDAAYLAEPDFVRLYQEHLDYYIDQVEGM